MAKSQSKISYHVVIDDLNNEQIDRLFNHLAYYRPRYINVKGGERFDKAMQFVEKASWYIPDTRVILRKWPDDGILKRYGYNPYVWYDEIIRPLENWLQTYRPIWLVDNESIEGNLEPYAQCTAEIMNIMGNQNLPVAVGRFATGNPAENQYSQLDAMWQGLKKWYGLHIWSPNEYFDQPDKLSGSGSITRFINGWNKCLEKYNFIPETVIGEFGLAFNYDPHRGYKTVGLDETSYAEICNHYLEHWYARYNVDLCLFSVGNWNGFEVSDIFYNYMENHPISVNVVKSAGIYENGVPPIEEPVTAIAFENSIRIREKPVNGRIIGHVNKNECIDVLENKQGISKQNEWIKIRHNNIEGYTAAWFYVSCYAQISTQNVQENNKMNSLFRALFDSVINRTTLLAVLTPIVAALLANIPNFPFSTEQITGVAVTIIIYLGSVIVTNGQYDRENVRAGNVWDKEHKAWIKPD